MAWLINRTQFGCQFRIALNRSMNIRRRGRKLKPARRIWKALQPAHAATHKESAHG